LKGLNIPTLKEQGFNVEIGNWRGVYGAADITPAQRKALIELVVKASRSKSWAESLAKNGWTSAVMTGDEFGEFVDREFASLRATMVNSRGYLRVGRLLEECDSFAGILAQLHCDDGDAATAPPLLVTAAFDRMDVLAENNPIPADGDLVLEGCVTHCGRTSLNIAIDVLPRAAAGGAPPPRPLLQAATTFVARDAAGRPVGVPRLVPTTPLEAALWEAGRMAQEERRRATLWFEIRPPARRRPTGSAIPHCPGRRGKTG
jgi:acyl-CoA hydrolase